MAGKPKKGAMQVTKASQGIWNAGIYARLSVDHHDRKNESIDTQIEIAKEYIRESKDIVLAGCYTDIGKTGTNFEREGFGRLMTDIRRHKITCVIVKDFSRFGRNYIETGNYIEKIFPFFNVRFISVSDGYDSHRTQGENDIFAVHLKNIVNELYARDCAEKVMAIKKSKLENGCYIGGVPSYGYYVKWVDGKRVLFPEEGTSDVVRKVYELFDGGNGIKDIIFWLYEQKVHRPSDYKRTGHVYCKEGESLKQWSGQTLRSILTNYVYIGALVQVLAGEKRYRSGESCNIEPDEVVMMEHTHKPIVGEEMFYRIANKIEKKRKKGLQKKGLQKDVLPEDIYKNLIYCGECGNRLKRICNANNRSYKTPVRTYSYGCPNIQRIDSLKCSGHYVSLNTISKVVLEVMRKEFCLSGIHMKTWVEFNRKQGQLKERDIEKRKRKIQAHIQGIDLKMSSLYAQYQAGRIAKETFLSLKADKEMEKSNWKKELSEQDIEMQRIKREVNEMDYFIRSLWKGEKSTVLGRQILHDLMKRIIVYKDRRVEVIFNFRNCLNYAGSMKNL